MAPKTRNFRAMEMPDFAGRRYQLIVSGEVFVTAGNQTPELTSHSPHGFNPRIKLLDLSIKTTGPIGTDPVEWRKIDPPYREPTNGRQYDEVNVLFEGDVVERLSVEHPKTVAAAPAKKKIVKKKAKKTTAKKKKAKKAVKKKAAKKTKKKAKKAKKKRL